MTEPATGRFEPRLPPGLTLRTVRDDEDVERVGALAVSVFGESIGGWTRASLQGYPDAQPGDISLVVDGAGRAVSSLQLLPWSWRYGAASFPAAEMVVVATAPEWRRQGLVQAQIEWYRRRAAERGCLVSQIQGIAGFYDRFGYEYAIPFEGGPRVEFRHLPSRQDGYKTRLAVPGDAATLAQLHEQDLGSLDLTGERREDHWRFLLGRSDDRPGVAAGQIWVVESEDGGIAGYWRGLRWHFGDEYQICEAAVTSYPACLALLQGACEQAQARGEPGLRISLPKNHLLMRLAHTLDAGPTADYAWQVAIPDPIALLRAIAPELEARIARSAFAGLTDEVVLDLCRTAIAMRFDAGRLAGVAPCPPCSEPVVRLPERLLAPLLFGYRSREELQEQHRGFSVGREQRLLLDTLFPPLAAWLYPIHY